MEEFRPIEGYPGYFISNLGRVKSEKRVHPIILKLRTNRHGYVIMVCSMRGTLVTLYVSRLVLAAFRGYPADPWLCYAHHIDGDLNNCSLENLEWMVCETTEEYDPSKSHRKGVLKPDFTKDRMSQAKYLQTEDTIDKARQTRHLTCSRRKIIHDKW